MLVLSLGEVAKAGPVARLGLRADATFCTQRRATLSAAALLDGLRFGDWCNG